MAQKTAKKIFVTAIALLIVLALFGLLASSVFASPGDFQLGIATKCEWPGNEGEVTFVFNATNNTAQDTNWTAYQADLDLIATFAVSATTSIQYPLETDLTQVNSLVWQVTVTDVAGSVLAEFSKNSQAKNCQPPTPTPTPTATPTQTPPPPSACDNNTYSINHDTMEVTGTATGEGTAWRVIRLNDGMVMDEGTGNVANYSFTGEYYTQYQVQFLGEDGNWSTENCVFDTEPEVVRWEPAWFRFNLDNAPTGTPVAGTYILKHAVQ